MEQEVFVGDACELVDMERVEEFIVTRKRGGGDGAEAFGKVDMKEVLVELCDRIGRGAGHGYDETPHWGAHREKTCKGSRDLGFVAFPPVAAATHLRIATQKYPRQKAGSVR